MAEPIFYLLHCIVFPVTESRSYEDKNLERGVVTVSFCREASQTKTSLMGVNKQPFPAFIDEVSFPKEGRKLAGMGRCRLSQGEDLSNKLNRGLPLWLLNEMIFSN